MPSCGAAAIHVRWHGTRGERAIFLCNVVDSCAKRNSRRSQFMFEEQFMRRRRNSFEDAFESIKKEPSPNAERQAPIAVRYKRCGSLVSRSPDYVGSSPYPFKDGDKRSALWFSRIIRIQRCVRGSGHEPVASPDCPLRHCVAGSGHKPNAKTSAYDEGNDSVIATADAPTRTQSIRDVSAIGNKCIRRRLRFVRSYCHEHYTYSC